MITVCIVPELSIDVLRLSCIKAIIYLYHSNDHLYYDYDSEYYHSKITREKNHYRDT
jgi:hypothetical protein